MGWGRPEGLCEEGSPGAKAEGRELCGWARAGQGGAAVLVWGEPSSPSGHGAADVALRLEEHS